MPTAELLGQGGLPDAQLLERLANELFKALPGDGSPKGAPGLGGASTSAAPLSVPSQDLLSADLPYAGPASGAGSAFAPIDLPYADELRTLFGGGTPGAVVATPSHASPFAGAAGPSFYFLQPATTPSAVPSVTPRPAQAPFDVHAVRRDFPILNERVNGRPLIWLDNAATTQKPKAVIERLTYFYLISPQAQRLE